MSAERVHVPYGGGDAVDGGEVDVAEGGTRDARCGAHLARPFHAEWGRFR
jgi:hypothetical protein